MRVDDRERLYAGGQVRLEIPDGDGGYTHRLKRPEELYGKEVSQVFAFDHIRDEVEQRAVIEHRRTRALTQALTEEVGDMVVDVEREGATLTIRGHSVFIPARDMRAVLRIINLGRRS